VGCAVVPGVPAGRVAGDEGVHEPRRRSRYPRDRTGAFATVTAMASLEELEARLAALEEQVQAIREDAAAARVLAGGADRDVFGFRAELRAHTATLNALRETQLEQGQAIVDLDQK